MNLSRKEFRNFSTPLPAEENGRRSRERNFRKLKQPGQTPSAWQTKDQIMKSSNPMTNQAGLPVWRRAAWLGLIPALLILCPAVAWKTESSPGYVENSAPQLEGSWLVTVTVDIPGAPSFPGLVSYTAGGVVMVSDPSVYPAYPMTTAYHGTWARKSGRDFVFTFMGFVYDNVDDGAPDGLWKIVNTESVTLEPGGDEYNGKGTLVQHGPDGSEISYNLTTHGTRIKAE